MTYSSSISRVNPFAVKNSLAQPALQGVIIVVAIFVEVSAQKFIGFYRDRSHLLFLSVTSVLLFDAPLLTVDISLNLVMLYFFGH